MPRVDRRPKRRTAGLTEWHILELLHGTAWPFLSLDQAFHGDRDALSQAWSALRAKLLPKWIRKSPGSRPWSWWAFEAPERRRNVDGGPHPFERPDRIERVGGTQEELEGQNSRAYALWYGVPAAWYAGDFDTKYETERAYLERLGLMDEQERAACDRAARRTRYRGRL